jgi:hypothetical protein
VWDRYYDVDSKYILNMPSQISTSHDLHKVTASTRTLIEFAPEVAFSSEDIPPRSVPVTVASANTVYVPNHLDSTDEPEWTPPQTFAEYISQLPEWERDRIQDNRSRSQIR